MRNKTFFIILISITPFIHSTGLVFIFYFFRIYGNIIGFISQSFVCSCILFVLVLFLLWFPPLFHLISFSVYGIGIYFAYVVFFLCSADFGTGSSVDDSLSGVFLCCELLQLLFLVGVEFIIHHLKISDLLLLFCYSGDILK